MPIDPALSAALAALAESGLPPMTSMTPPQFRALESRLDLSANPALAPVAEVADTTVPGPGGPLPARVYRPLPAPDGLPGGAPDWPAGDGARPTLVWFHGGGWVIGSIDSHDLAVRQLAARTGAVVVSVGYRLAPEDPFPAAVDDALAATRAVADRIAELGGDPALLAVGGDSAGGNLAAVVAQQLRDARRAGDAVPQLAAQVLAYPATDFVGNARGDYPSRAENAAGPVLTDDDAQWFARHYLGERGPDELADPRISPLRAADLSDLPPAVVTTARYDLLRDEGVAYADAMRAAGVRVLAWTAEAMPHGFLSWTQLSPAALAALHHLGDDLVTLLRG